MLKKIGVDEEIKIRINKEKIRELENENHALSEIITKKLIEAHKVEKDAIYYSEALKCSVKMFGYVSRPSQCFFAYCDISGLTEDEVLKEGKQRPYELIGVGKKVFKNGKLSARGLREYSIDNFKPIIGENNV